MKFLTFFFIVMSFIVLVLIGLSFLPQIELQGQQNPSEILNLISNHTAVRNGQTVVDTSAFKTVKNDGGWLQILNESGQVIYQYSTPQGLQTKYAPGELISIRNTPKEFGYQVYSWFVKNNANKLTWIYAVPYTRNTIESITGDYRTWAVIALLIASVALTAAFLFGIRIGKPILHALSWIENLSKGIYTEPLNKNDQSMSLDRNGRLRRSYWIFREVMQSVDTLSLGLKESDEKKKQLDKAREEWISGISHDMKTPLSSVKGYADMLSSDRYQFEQEQTKKYARIISQKALYMQELIDDLNLTFQLSNCALPVNLRLQNVVELARRAMIDIVNSGLWDGINFVFLNSENEIIFCCIDEKWFKRSMDNLLANAAEHNYAGTTVSIFIKMSEPTGHIPAVEIIIADDGKGMNAQEIEHLFDRYYRGASTNNREVKGSGLGTAIAKQLIEAQGGTIAVRSKLQKGTEITIRFPDN